MVKYFTLILSLLALLDSGWSKNLSFVRSFDPSNYELLDIEIQGNRMIVPGGLGGAVLYDISDPQFPVQKSILKMQPCRWSRSYNWALTSSLAVGTARECGMQIFNIKDVSQPQRLAKVNPSEDIFDRGGRSTEISLEDVEIDQSTAIFAAHADGLILYDISEPSNPVYVSHFATSNAWSLAVLNHIVYVADGDGGISIIDISDLRSPRLLSSHSTSGSARDIRITKNGILFVAVGAAGVDAFDVQDPEHPIFLDNFPTAGFASRIAVNGRLVGVSAWIDFEVLEWNGSNFSLVGYKNTGGRVMASGSPGGDLFYSAEWQTFRIYKYGPIAGPDIDVFPRALNYSHLEIGQADTLKIRLENNGASELNILGYGITHKDFTVYPEIGRLTPGEKSEINVVYQATSDIGAGTLEIVSNDSDEQSVRISLNGNKRFNTEVGLPAPDFSLPIIANGTGSIHLQSLRGRVVVLAMFASW